jgi:hypothetical protein
MDSLIADLILPHGPTAVIVQRMLHVLEQERPKKVCIDEIDKLTINQPVLTLYKVL